MKQSVNPIRSEHYQQTQRELERLLEVADGSNHNAALSLQEELEAEFVDAWSFSGDSDGRSLEMRQMAALHCGGFDHCSYYYESRTKSHVVVTQPYRESGEVVELLKQGLVVSERMGPRIIAAAEWGFYYPGHATLIVVKFPPGYGRILQAMSRLWWPPAKWSLERN